MKVSVSRGISKFFLLLCLQAKASERETVREKEAKSQKLRSHRHEDEEYMGDCCSNPKEKLCVCERERGSIEEKTVKVVVVSGGFLHAMLLFYYEEHTVATTTTTFS